MREFESSESLGHNQGFLPAREFSQTWLRFSPGYGGTDNMFYFFYKIIIFSLNKEKDDIQSAYCKFSQLGDSQPHCSRYFRASKRDENTFVDQSKCTYYTNYFIINNQRHPMVNLWSKYKSLNTVYYRDYSSPISRFKVCICSQFSIKQQKGNLMSKIKTKILPYYHIDRMR